MYSRYIPQGADLKVRFTNTYADSLKCVIVPIYGTSVVYSNVDQLDEAPRRIERVVGPTGSKAYGTISAKADFGYMYGLDTSSGNLQPVATKLLYRCSTTSNPSFIIGWQVTFHTVGSTGASLTVPFDFELVVHGVFCVRVPDSLNNPYIQQPPTIATKRVALIAELD